MKENRYVYFCREGKIQQRGWKATHATHPGKDKIMQLNADGKLTLKAKFQPAQRVENLELGSH